MDLGAVFITGLLTGGLSCLAVQGGLLVATLAQRESFQEGGRILRNNNVLPIVFFLFSKLTAYMILGVLLGWFGSLFQLSLKAQVAMQFLIAFFMIGTAFNLLDIHPIFRYFVIQPPKFLFRLLRKQSQSRRFFAPILLGAFTVFIPCGTTQAMMALAIGSGSPWIGAAILFTFILGTSPTFFVLGFIANKLGDMLENTFMKVAAVAIIALVIFNINAAITLSGSKYTLDYVWQDIKCTTLSICENKVLAEAAWASSTGEITINLEDSGYSPKEIQVKAGTKVKLNLKNVNARGCIQSFTIPKLDIQKVVRTGTSDVVEFVAPDKPGDLAFMCGMGMYKGNIKII